MELNELSFSYGTSSKSLNKRTRYEGSSRSSELLGDANDVPNFNFDLFETDNFLGKDIEGEGLLWGKKKEHVL